MNPLSSERVPVLLSHSYYLKYDPKQVRKMKPYAPLSTLITASTLRDAGMPLQLFDSMLSEGVEEFVDRVRAARPKVVAIFEDNFNFLTKMCTTRMRDAAFTMIAAAKDVGARVAVNGSDATDQPDGYLAAGADAVVLGETEHTFLELAHTWLRDAQADLTDVAGLALGGPTGAEPRFTPQRRSVGDLDALPFPAWDLIDIERYREAWTTAHGRFSWNACTSRGCPFGCNWCAKPMFGRRYTQRTPGNVAEELSRLAQVVRPDHLWFADDIFGLTSAWIESFAREMGRRQVKIPFSMQSRVDLMTPTGVEALAAAGCEEVWLGVESGSQKILDGMNKGMSVDEVGDATSRLKEHGIKACWFIQLGYSGENWDDVLATRDLVRAERPDDIGVSVAYPLPGTVFYDRVRAELSAKENWSDSDDLAMLFRGTYTTDFYRQIRDLLHEEALALANVHPMAEWPFDARWDALKDREADHRAESAVVAKRAVLGG
ncbi:MAG: B12-binding domain-containing radical SAM protein [Gemmatimonadetes bacterium]|nr:B12-binding domain-containing radical SAM protein [Gemmatimonadota bacterium]